MTSSDILDLAVKLFAAWTVGFSVGWSITNFRDALSRI